MKSVKSAFKYEKYNYAIRYFYFSSFQKGWKINAPQKSESLHQKRGSFRFSWSEWCWKNHHDEMYSWHHEANRMRSEDILRKYR